MMIPISIQRLLLAGILPVLFSAAAVSAQDQSQVRQEEATDYYKKWLNEDVVYIISPEERSVFQNLGTPEEKEQFIEQFWRNRDSDPRTAVNEFKEEHFRRLAYVNERYFSGKPGWKTDRGRIYIIHGPPTEVESHPSGGTYDRPASEGGGRTVAYPYEVWRYRNLQGIDDDVILEFVDKEYTGEYRLSHMPEDKDALLYIPGQGATEAEMRGWATRAERPIFKPGGRDLYPFMPYGLRDDPFYKYEIYAKVQTPPQLRHKDLKELISVKIDYVNLPIRYRQDAFALNQAQVLAPITIEMDNQNLSFERQGNHHVAKVAIYGLITAMGNRYVQEFEHDLVTSFSGAELQSGLLRSSIFQKILTLEAKGRFKIDLVVKDLNSGNTAYLQKALVFPRFGEAALTASSIILSNYIQVLEDAAELDEMFLLGDVKIRPSMNRTFYRDEPFGAYFQLYNVAIDQATSQPALEIVYRVTKEGKAYYSVQDQGEETIQYFSPQRAVLIRLFDIPTLSAGEYKIEIEALDRIKGEKVKVSEDLTLLDRDAASGQVKR